MYDIKTASRRTFLRKAAGVVAFPYAVRSSALGKAGTVAPSNRILFGAVGIGWQGENNMQSLMSKKETQFLAVCDVDDSHLSAARDWVEKKYGNRCATYKDFRELFARGDLDAVCIALPDHWHSIAAIAAAKAGLDIHGEKPLAHSITEGRALCNAVREYGRIWQTGSWQRSVTNFYFACMLVRNGLIGRVHTVEVGLGGGFSDYANTKGQETPSDPPPGLDYERWLGPAPWAPYCPARVHKNWRWHTDYGGGRIMDWVGHHVDIAHWGMGCDYGGPVEIEGVGEAPSTGLWNAVTDYDVICKYAGGITMRLSNTLRGGTRWIGDEGWVYVNRGRLDAQPKRLLKERFGPNNIRLYKSSDHMQNFLNSIKTRSPTITPVEVAHRSASVGHLALIAIRLGRKLSWNPATETFVDDPDAQRLLSRSMRRPWHS